jgi:hypothetical protein
MIAGATAVAIAGFLHGLRKMQEKITLPLMAVVASPLEQAFDPSKPASVLQWNPNAVSGSEAWLYALLTAAAFGCLWYYVFFYCRRWPKNGG